MGQNNFRIACQRHGRNMVRHILGCLVPWQRASATTVGYTIVLPVPWDIRHLLPVNLQFVSRTDLRDLHRIHIVFDRSRRPGVEKLLDDTRRQFSHLPLQFSFHPRIAGWVAERVGSAAFYHALSAVCALGESATRYAILHDFDLYPLVPNYFSDVYRALKDRGLKFAGHELSTYDGLVESDRILGTWCLGMDVDALRANYRASDCFHRIIRNGHRWQAMDPFTLIESMTPERDRVGTVIADGYCHARNLCSTYLQFVKGQNPNIVWRLHYLWYLESLGGDDGAMRDATHAMEAATSASLHVRTCRADFFRTDPTCANVLAKEVRRMEEFVHRECRPEVNRFLLAFENFLDRYGSQSNSAPAPAGVPAPISA
jgi:hypothetical protein